MNFNNQKPEKPRVLKAGFDLFFLKAIGLGGLGIVAIAVLPVEIGGVHLGLVVLKHSMDLYAIHQNVIQEGTKLLLTATLGPNPEVNREVFVQVVELFKVNNLTNEQVVQALKALFDNVIEYRDKQILPEVEREKVIQVAVELKKGMTRKKE
uniref:hypothetical protein n=1 Tax=Dictyostelium intermedium TaxID=361076 RepID=UPI001D1112A5|nr:hypothetical protein LKZ32_mgp14 [Dictyostelium intermedium]DAZ85382.1 TPA_asm: hypothetical protein [Dictyostelium intermedium]